MNLNWISSMPSSYLIFSHVVKKKQKIKKNTYQTCLSRGLWFCQQYPAKDSLHSVCWKNRTRETMGCSERESKQVHCISVFTSSSSVMFSSCIGSDGGTSASTVVICSKGAVKWQYESPAQQLLSKREREGWADGKTVERNECNHDG